MSQIWTLDEALERIDPDRPLVVSDADEVLLQFISGLEAFLGTAGYALQLTSFAIHGNVRHQATGEAAASDEVSALLARFFAETPGLAAVPGAVAALDALSSLATVLVLSNVPAGTEHRRVDNLRGLGFAAPLVRNDGLKGDALARLSGATRAPVVFIDDLAPHHTAVAKAAPHVGRLHFVADPRLAALAPPARDAHARIDTWPEARAWIAQRLTETAP